MSSDGSKHDGSDGTTTPPEVGHTPHNGHQPKVHGSAHGEGVLRACTGCGRQRASDEEIAAAQAGFPSVWPTRCWAGCVPAQRLRTDEETTTDADLLRQRLIEARETIAVENCGISGILNGHHEHELRLRDLGKRLKPRWLRLV